MILNCIGVTRITGQMLEEPDKLSKLEIESIEPSIEPEVRGSAFYLAYGNSAPLTLGAMIANALERGEQIFTVEVSLKVTPPKKDETVIHNMRELKKANLLVLNNIRQPIADVITTHWHTWVESGKADLILSEKDKANKFTEANVLRDMIARYPVFIEHLMQQTHFSHIKHVMFKAYTDEGNLVYLVALSSDPERYPDIPKGGINCSAVGDEIPVELPAPGKLKGGVKVTEH